MPDNGPIVHADHSKPYKKKHAAGKTLIFLLILAVIAGAIYLLFDNAGTTEERPIGVYESAVIQSGTMVDSAEASGTVVLPKQVSIVSRQDAYTAQLHVNEGDVISTSDILVSLSVPELEDALASYELQLEQAEIELENTRLNYSWSSRAIELDQQRLVLKIEEAVDDVVTQQRLAELKSSRTTDLEQATDALDALYEQQEDLAFSLEELSAKQVLAEKKQEAVIRQLKMNIAQIEDDITDSSITSPIAGEILQINEELEIEGSFIEKTDTLFVVADRSEVYIDLDIYEQYAAILQPGDHLTLTIRTSTMDARITRIGKIATLDSDGLSATVSVRAEPITETVLTPGASAIATIILSTKDDTMLLPRGSYLTTGNQKYLYVIDGNTAVRTEVTYGNIQGGEVEILSGVEPGDRVITSSYQQFINQQTITLP
jgi:HlyD family secretion protein